MINKIIIKEKININEFINYLFFIQNKYNYRDFKIIFDINNIYLTVNAEYCYGNSIDTTLYIYKNYKLFLSFPLSKDRELLKNLLQNSKLHDFNLSGEETVFLINNLLRIKKLNSFL